MKPVIDFPLSNNGFLGISFEVEDILLRCWIHEMHSWSGKM